MLDVLYDGAFVWSGVFAFGDTNHSAAYFLRSTTQLFVVANGAGYLLDAVRPEGWTTLPISNIKGTVFAPRLGVVVGYNDWELFVVWDLGRVGDRELDSDGIHDVTVEGDTVKGTADRVSLGGLPEKFALRIEDANFPLIDLNARG